MLLKHESKWKYPVENRRPESMNTTKMWRPVFVFQTIVNILLRFFKLTLIENKEF